MKRDRLSDASIAEPKRVKADADTDADGSNHEEYHPEKSRPAVEKEEISKSAHDSKPTIEKPASDSTDAVKNAESTLRNEQEPNENSNKQKESEKPEESKGPKSTKGEADKPSKTNIDKSSEPSSQNDQNEQNEQSSAEKARAAEESKETDKTEEKPEEKTQQKPVSGFSSFSKSSFGGGFGSFGASSAKFAAPASNPWAEPKKTNPWAEPKPTESSEKSSTESTETDAKSAKENTPSDSKRDASEDVYAQVTLEKQDSQTGEENEETVHQVRIRSYAIDSTSSDKAWKERGVGLSKSNRSRDAKTGEPKYRLVSRTDSVLKVKLNSPLLPNMQVTKGFDSSLHTEKFVRVAGIEEGKAHQFALRCGTEAARDELYDAIDAAIKGEA